MIPGRLAPGSPVLAAQRWTGILLTLDDTRPAGNGDLGIVASWVLRQAPAAPFAGSGPQVERPGNLGGSDPWEDAESWQHSGSTPRSCASAR